MNYNIALLHGDGIGPEIVNSAVRVLERIAERFDHKFNFTSYDIGGIAIDKQLHLVHRRALAAYNKQISSGNLSLGNL